MEYPIKKDAIINDCREYFATRGLEFNQEDEQYIHSFVNLINRAYAAGVQSGIYQK